MRSHFETSRELYGQQLADVERQIRFYEDVASKKLEALKEVEGLPSSPKKPTLGDVEALAVEQLKKKLGLSEVFKRDQDLEVRMVDAFTSFKVALEEVQDFVEDLEDNAQWS